MTRIDEMDEFFNFEDATNLGMTLDGHRISSPRHAPSSLYDIDLILAQAADDDDSFNSLQHFEIDPPPNASQYTSGNVEDVQMVEPDFSNYPNWINGAERPPKPCLYCGTHKLDCLLVIPAGGPGQKPTCASCSSLSRQCSFSFEKPVNSPEFREPFPPYVGGSVNGLEGKVSSFVDKDELRCSLLDRNACPRTPLPGSGASDHGSESPGKMGARFSRDTVRLLRNWVSVHHLHPYPTEEEKEDLKRKTGLTITQIGNWLANARRRGQVKPPRGKSPGPRTFCSKPINIRRRFNPALQHMDPMERWECSPPEHEPASVVDIAKAVQTSPNIPSNGTSPDSYPRSDDGSVQSITRKSSASSRGTSHSSHASSGSALSIHSRGSFGSFGQRGRRRRRPAAKLITNLTAGSPRQYQCTFCIESFKTKHDWQRHEKSLHLSLERWVCAPGVSKALGTPHKCAFCGLQNPDTAHYDKHNYNVCQERSLEERTFYRKDHLRQHLRLVHECQFLSASMESWKIAAPQVRSRCGFCGYTMNTWSARVDHLAEHFKAGETMADWIGSWGFDADVQKLVENGTSPHLIHSKRVAAMPKEPTSQIEQRDITPYDLVKGQLLEYANKQALLGRDLTDGDLKTAASRVMSNYRKNNDPTGSISSWFLDLILCHDDRLWLEDLRQKAGFGTKQQRQGNSSSPKPLDINNKESVERCCELERQLIEFANTQRSLGLTPTDAELKDAACRILLDYDKIYSTIRSDDATTWLCGQIMASHAWTEWFRRRVGLPPSTGVRNGQVHPEEVDLNKYETLEAKLAEFVKVQRGLGVIPSDADLKRQARLIIFEVDDPFLQTAADDTFWLVHFKINHGLHSVDRPVHPITPESSGDLSQSSITSGSSDPTSSVQNSPLPQPPGKSRNLYSLQDTRCYRRLDLELSRFIASYMSKHSHVPTDDEIRQQARSILHSDDGPWNQTAVDKEEWLLHFKRSNGLAPAEDGSGMPKAKEGVDMHFGGARLTPSNLRPDGLVEVTPLMHGDINTDWKNPTVSYGSPLNIPYNSIPRPAIHTTFCSRKLESSLADYVRQSLAQGYMPTDEQLRNQARVIVGRLATSADDLMLLQKFKELHGTADRPSYTNNPIHSSSTMDFGAPPQISPPAYLTSNTNMEVSKMFANWTPTHGRPRSTAGKEQNDLQVRRMRDTNASAPASRSISRDNYHKIDPRTKELAAHLTGIVGGYGNEARSTHIAMGQ